MWAEHYSIKHVKGNRMQRYNYSAVCKACGRVYSGASIAEAEEQRDACKDMHSQKKKAQKMQRARENDNKKGNTQ